MPFFHRTYTLLKSISSVWITGIVIFTGCQNFQNIRTQETDRFPMSYRPLTVMSYNIRVGYGGKDRGVDPYILSKRQENIAPIIAAIQSVGPDIIGLQEVRGSDQARRLALALDMNYAYAWHETDNARQAAAFLGTVRLGPLRGLREGLIIGVGLAIGLAFVLPAAAFAPALLGLYLYEHAYVRAGQLPPLS